MVSDVVLWMRKHEQLIPRNSGRAWSALLTASVIGISINWNAAGMQFELRISTGSLN
jgi:hypothetical protein